jgi:hypothetical protein
MRLPKHTKETMIDIFILLSLVLTLLRVLGEELRLLF